MHQPLKVLITNNTLAHPAGTECYVRDIAIALLKLGHKPIAYSNVLGDIAHELRRATVPVVDDLNTITQPPDIIHGHHHLDTMTALLHFPQTPAIYYCHGWLPWQEKPLKFPRIMRYVAVDEVCKDRFLFENGIDKNKVHLLLNFVDLNRFKPRNVLPKQPKKALIFSNYANSNNYYRTIEAVCQKLGMEVTAVGMGVNNYHIDPETTLKEYDIVFAKARAAIEALAVGNAVIVCDALGMGEMVTPDNFEYYRQLNFGIRTLQNPVTVENLKKEILKYNAEGAEKVSQIIRSNAGLENSVTQLVSLYYSAIHEYHEKKSTLNPAEEYLATSTYIKELKPILNERGLAYHQLNEHCNQLQQQLNALSNSKIMRIRSFILKLPLIGKFLKKILR